MHEGDQATKLGLLRGHRCVFLSWLVLVPWCSASVMSSLEPPVEETYLQSPVTLRGWNLLDCCIVRTERLLARAMFCSQSRRGDSVEILELTTKSGSADGPN